MITEGSPGWGEEHQGQISAEIPPPQRPPPCRGHCQGQGFRPRRKAPRCRGKKTREKEGERASPAEAAAAAPGAALTVDQLFHLVVPGPQVGLGVGSLGREGLAARGGAGLGAAPGSAGGRRLLVLGLPVAPVPGALAGSGPAALAGHGHGEEPGSRAAAPPQRRHAQRHGPAAAARTRPGLRSAPRRPGPRQHPPGGQSPPRGARGPGRATPGREGPGGGEGRGAAGPGRAPLTARRPLRRGGGSRGAAGGSRTRWSLTTAPPPPRPSAPPWPIRRDEPSRAASRGRRPRPSARLFPGLGSPRGRCRAPRPGHADEQEGEAPLAAGAWEAALRRVQVPALLLPPRGSHGVVHD
ncbi:hypothetical protein Q9966_007169 [Columba livia]|nr:hypothetical protein Q9966_007169 [Columba livia]